MKTLETKLGTATLKNKAWIINVFDIMEPWYIPEEPFFGETNSEAKSKAFKAIGSDTYAIRDKYGDWQDLTYLNLRMIRTKHHDQYELNGEVLSVRQIQDKEERLIQKETLEQLIIDNPEAFVYIKKGGYYYGPKYCGYTESPINAGIYPIKDGVREVLGCDIKDNMKVILIEKEIHNQRIKKRISELESLIIN